MPHTARLVPSSRPVRFARRHGVVLTLIALMFLSAAACTGSLIPGQAMGPTNAVTTPTAREYWPTTGWRTAEPEDHGVDPAGLAELERQLAAGYPHVRSVLIVRNGYLVYEHYRPGLNALSGHDIRSATQSVISALIGIA